MKTIRGQKRQCDFAASISLAVLMGAGVTLPASAALPKFTSAVELKRLSGEPAGIKDAEVLHIDPVSAGYGAVGTLNGAPVRWDANGTATSLPLPDVYDGGYVYVYGANNAGQVVGTVAPGRAVRWEANGSPTLLAPPAPDGYAVFAYGINNAGQAVGAVGEPTYDLRGARWAADGSCTVLGDVPGQTTIRGFAYNISDSGIAVGSVDVSEFERDAVRWAADGSATLLGKAPGSWGSATYAIGVNNAGEAAGYTVFLGGAAQAVRWATDGSATRLADLPGHDIATSAAWGITNEGLIGGEQYEPGVANHIVIWDTDGMPARLEDLMADGNAWSFREFDGIDADTTMVRVSAIGSKNGGPLNYYLLEANVPEPASVSLLAVAALMLHRSRPGRTATRGRSPARSRRENRIATLVLAATGFFAAMCATVTRAAPGDILNLGDFGGVRSDGFGINNAGQVAGYYETDLPADYAYRYNAITGAAVPFDLGTLGSKYSVGYDINASGQVVGDSFVSDTGIRHAFRYDGTPGSGGIMRDLGTLGTRESFAYGINAAGQVTGTFDTTDFEHLHAFIYSGTPGSGGVMLDLGTLPGGSGAIGRSINNAGHIVGEAAGFPVFAFHAFKYTGTPGAGGAMVDLGTLGGTNSVAKDINDAGQIAGFSYMPGDNTLHAFRYTGTPGAGGVMVDLGVPPGASDSTGCSIDSRGNIVGFADAPGDVRHAALWPMTGGAIDLDAWLDATNPSGGAFWTLTYAYGINDNGLITGEGVYDDWPGGLTDGIRAYVLDASTLTSVPEPGALWMLAVAAAGLQRRRSNRCPALQMRSNIKARRRLALRGIPDLLRKTH
jgi:probable HAF family extracellular repeat protein